MCAWLHKKLSRALNGRQGRFKEGLSPAPSMREKLDGKNENAEIKEGVFTLRRENSLDFGKAGDAFCLFFVKPFLLLKNP